MQKHLCSLVLLDLFDECNYISTLLKTQIYFFAVGVTRGYVRAMQHIAYGPIHLDFTF